MLESRTDLPQGPDAVQLLSALGNPHRLRVVAALMDGRQYVSQLARTLQLSRPLVQVHLKKLEAVGVISSHMEVSPDGKARNFYELTAFCFELSPQSLATAARLLSPDSAATSTRKAPRT